MKRIEFRPEPTSLRNTVSDFVARRALANKGLERALVAGCHSPLLRRGLRLGAFAMAYPRVLEQSEVRVAQLNGYKLCVNVREHMGVGPFFFGDSGTSWITHRLVNAGDVCVDAGANIGHYTFLTASLVGPAGRVFAFEPNPPYAALIARSIALNEYRDRVAVDRRALWDRSGEHMKFFVSNNPTNSGTSSLVDHGCFLTPTNVTEVETLTFTDFAEEKRVDHFGLIKIDVERAEFQVLTGMVPVLSAHAVDYMIVEMLAHSNAQQVLTDQGYACFLLDEGHRRLVDMGNVPAGHFGDYLAVSPKKLKQLKIDFTISDRVSEASE